MARPFLCLIIICLKITTGLDNLNVCRAADWADLLAVGAKPMTQYVRAVQTTPSTKEKGSRSIIVGKM